MPMRSSKRPPANPMPSGLSPSRQRNSHHRVPAHGTSATGANTRSNTSAWYVRGSPLSRTWTVDSSGARDTMESQSEPNRKSHQPGKASTLCEDSRASTSRTASGAVRRSPQAMQKAAPRSDRACKRVVGRYNDLNAVEGRREYAPRNLDTVTGVTLDGVSSRDRRQHFAQ